MELSCRDLHAAADSKTQSLSNLKHAENNPGYQECLLLSRVWAIRKRKLSSAQSSAKFCP
jgi:hypothetical protein